MSAADNMPAFPATEAHGLNNGEMGLSMRDYFAAKALNGLCASFSDYDAREHALQNAIASGRTPKEQVAFAAYEYADAMLSERAK